jgi:hypothetical protein
MDFGSILGSVADIFGISSASRDAKKNRQAQEEANRNAIQWRVADAKKAGIHPLYAMGNPGISHTPVYSSAGEHMSSLGQNLGRAVMSAATGRERREAAATAAQRESIQFDQDTQRRELENQYLRTQIALLDRSQVPPSAPPLESGAAPGTVRVRPSEPIASSPDNPARQAGSINDVQFFRRNDGGIGLTYSEQMRERSEDDMVEQGLWQWRNRMLPFLSGRSPPRGPSTREFPLPSGQTWRWDGRRQGFFPWRVNQNTWVN